MPQNRKKLIDLFIGHISEAVSHEILIRSTENKEIASHYKKELENLLDRSKKYREKINPKNSSLPEKDIDYIKTKIIIKVKTELKKRISLGYKNIDLGLIEILVDKFLKEAKIS
ncbi:MAG: hypothetical protein KKG75_03805 [Nanoarchaeota archaeon]|nr:hypothetical protein [Nanoarchaeota archaeon]